MITHCYKQGYKSFCDVDLTVLYLQSHYCGLASIDQCSCIPCLEAIIKDKDINKYINEPIITNVEKRLKQLTYERDFDKLLK